MVAETFEQARTAAQRVQVKYARSPGAFDLEAARGSAKPQRVTGGPADTAVGDFAGAFASAPVKLDATYTTPDQAHAMMEPFASIAAWEGDKLTLWTANQMINWARRDMALTLGIPQENVRVISPYIGGGFGGKLFLRADALLAALAARAVKRPVKVALHASDDDQQHRAPPRHHPAHSAWRDCRWQAHGRRTRILVRGSAWRQARGRGAPLAHHVRRAESHDDHAPRRTRPARGQCHARTR